FMNVPRPTRRQLAAHQSMVRGPVLRQGRICIVLEVALRSFARDKRTGSPWHPDVWCLAPVAEARKPVKYSMTMLCLGGAPRGLLKASYARRGRGIQLPSTHRIVGGHATGRCRVRGRTAEGEEAGGRADAGEGAECHARGHLRLSVR